MLAPHYSLTSSLICQSQAPGPHVGISESATEFLVSGGPWGQAKGSNSLSRRMAAVAGSALAHHSNDPGYEGAQAPSGNAEASSPSSDDEDNETEDEHSEGRDSAGNDVEMTEM